MYFESHQIDDIYFRACRELLRAPKINNTRELNNVMFRLTNINKNIISIRDLSPSYLFGELLWYFNGLCDLEFISKFSSFWNHLSDDGFNCNSAYGYLMMHYHGFDQIEKIIELLQVDPLSRRAVINLNVPNENVIETKDEPCTIALQFLIRDDCLHCTTMMRSNDVWFGFPYDVAFFTELQKYIADRLNVNYGTYTHFVTSFHLYDRDYDKISSIVKYPNYKSINFNGKAFHEHKKFLAEVMKYSRNPKKDIIKLFKLFEIYKEE